MTSIPLPEHLKECGCPWAAHGIHKTTCAPARWYEATPLKEREGYGPGVSFQMVRWDFPLSMEVDMVVRVSLDPCAVIERHREEYEAFFLPDGFEEWEKPMVFLWGKIEAACEEVSVEPFDFVPRESQSRTYVNATLERPKWTREDTERLHRSLSHPKDPNQGALFEEGDA